MSKRRLIRVGVITLTLVSSMPTSSAIAAPKYMWGLKSGAEPETELGAGTKKEVKGNIGNVSMEFKWIRAATRLTVTCTAAKWRSEVLGQRPELEGGVPGKIGPFGSEGQEMVLTGCTVPEPVGQCEVTAGEITTAKLQGELASNPFEEGLVRMYGNGGKFVKINLSTAAGGTCNAAGAANIEGELVAELNPTKKAAKPLEFKLNSAINQYINSGNVTVGVLPLKEEGNACGTVTVSGKFTAELVSGEAFGFL